MKYTPVLEGPLYQIFGIINNNKYRGEPDAKWLLKPAYYKMRFKLLFQQLYITYLLVDNDYIHRDAHHGNWLYKKNSKPLVFGKYKLSCPYQLYLGDFGSIIHKSHKKVLVINRILTSKESVTKTYLK